jgi:hypothetical protein
MITCQQQPLATCLADWERKHERADELAEHASVLRAFNAMRPFMLASLEQLPKRSTNQDALEKWRAAVRAQEDVAVSYAHGVFRRTLNLNRVFEILIQARFLLLRAPVEVQSAQWHTGERAQLTRMPTGDPSVCFRLEQDSFSRERREPQATHL